jgi:hypothetical protein
MPRAPAKIRKRFTEGIEILDCETEMTLLEGEGILGTVKDLRTLEDWKMLWARWRDVIMPKALKWRPGTRPFACYVVGEIAERQVLIEPPLSNTFFKLYVPSRGGSGQWHYRYPEPFMRAEHLHLQDLGMLDDDELKRYRAYRRGSPIDPKTGRMETYPLEQGLYE